MQQGFLKCFYGYKNRGDELLFWGIIDYIATHYPDVEQLDIEVADVVWMHDRRERHREQMKILNIADTFVSGVRQIRFVPLSRNIGDNFRYDIYFFGGGELFAESRGFHGGWNYLIRYFFAINSKPYILLGGFEKATKRWQKILYKYIFPRAKAIICRDQTSCQTVSRYVSELSKIILHEDFAIKVIEGYKSTALSISKNPSIPQSFSPSIPYALVNLIEHRLDDEAKSIIQKYYQNYHDKVIYFPCTAKDRQWQETLTSRGIKSEIYDRKDHTIQETLGLFAQADAVVGSRLHFLLPAQILDRPRLAISYAEKIDKLIVSTI